MTAPGVKLRSDGHEVVVLIGLFDGTEIPVGVGATAAAAIVNARETLALALTAIDDTIADFESARSEES